MKYTNEITTKISHDYLAGVPTSSLAEELGVPERSVIAKLASLGIYKKKQYLTKNEEIPVKKEEYVEKIAKLLGKDVELLESLEKANKNVLKMLEVALSETN